MAASSGSCRSREWEASDRKLKKELGFQQLFFVSFGSIIGSGWLFATLTGAAIAGPAAIISWIIGGILVIFIALNYAEVACMMPRSGAVVRYPHLSHGGFLGFLMAWAFLLATVTVTGVEAEAAVQYAASYATDMNLTTTSNGVTILTGLGLIFAIFLMIVFFLINFFGVKFFGEFNRWVPGGSSPYPWSRSYSCSSPSEART